MTVDEYLGPHGILSQKREYRNTQLEMARIIESMLRDGGRAVIEAPCGTGKSYAYLFPLADYIARNGETRDVEQKDGTTQEEARHVAVCAPTTLLQSQLVSDAQAVCDTVNAHRGSSVNFCLLKGLGNFACAEKKNIYYHDDAQREARSLLLEGEWNGDKSKSPVILSDEQFSEMTTTHDDCLKNECKYAKQCGYMQQRVQVEKSNIIITNHTMAIINSDFAKCLPEYDAIVFDEAHKLPEIARAIFEEKITLRSLTDKNREICEKLFQDNTSGDAVDVLSKFEKKINDLFSGLISALDMPDDKFELSLNEHFFKTKHFNPNRFPLRENIELAQQAIECCDNLAVEADSVRGESIRYRDRLKRNNKKIVERLRHLFGADDEKYAYRSGFVKKNGQWTLSLTACLIDPGEKLASGLFSDSCPTLLTSATLRPMDYIKRMTGVGDALTVQLSGIFDYWGQSRYAMSPRAHERPKDKSLEREWHQQTSLGIFELIETTSKGVLILFASNDAMRNCAYHVRAMNPKRLNDIVVQGEATKEKIIDGMNNSHIIVFGVSSFWEGVDVSGDGLAYLVIHSLPMAPPDCIGDALKKRDEKGYFEKHVIPSAALRLIQGHGRLLRSKTDRGAIIFLDPRIDTTFWGRKLFMFLPEAPIVSFDEALKFVENA